MLHVDNLMIIVQYHNLFDQKLSNYIPHKETSLFSSQVLISINKHLINVKHIL